jgi:hypothetical protein
MMQWLFANEMVTMLLCIRLSMLLSGTLTELTGRFIRSVSPDSRKNQGIVDVLDRIFKLGWLAVQPICNHAQCTSQSLTCRTPSK